eukprot:CAMPEP_0198304002 /NCGR_PEP_ID=MMETSP1449-20131203/57170_1 /TAXON_ID=420275 /ORGANISM="Attheya septentrionalis, Strain CCMP2084" /LENGTH=524 /DNA_ID=CAMNT_0044006513 /DNA_START=114 /DNA_END=1688 /DNA_ORIENTATION=-
MSTNRKNYQPVEIDDGPEALEFGSGDDDVHERPSPTRSCCSWRVVALYLVAINAIIFLTATGFYFITDWNVVNILPFFGGNDDPQANQNIPSIPSPNVGLIEDYTLKCVSDTHKTKSVVREGLEVVPKGFRLIQATIHQRYLGSWMDEHKNIDNVCWKDQLKSASSQMNQKCPHDISTVWEEFEFHLDPYSAPEKGRCEPKQITTEGRRHAQDLGHIYRSLFAKHEGDLCKNGNIMLETGDSSQVAQSSLQNIYKGICGSLPDPSQYPKKSVVNDGTVAPQSPFFLQLSVCKNDYITEAWNKVSKKLTHSKSYVLNTLKEVADTVGSIAQKIPDDNPYLAAPFLDSMEDCVVSHACLELEDVPDGMLDNYKELDTAVTGLKLFPYSFWSDTEYKRFVSNVYGYYFTTVLHRMKKGVEREYGSKYGKDLDGAALLYVQVNSDERITQQLQILGAPEALLSRKPAWGSQIIYQLLRQETAGEQFFFRVLYDGHEIVRMQKLDAFTEFAMSVAPSKEDCPAFFNNFP